MKRITISKILNSAADEVMKDSKINLMNLSIQRLSFCCLQNYFRKVIKSDAAFQKEVIKNVIENSASYTMLIQANIPFS